MLAGPLQIQALPCGPLNKAPGRSVTWAHLQCDKTDIVIAGKMSSCIMMSEHHGVKVEYNMTGAPQKYFDT